MGHRLLRLAGIALLASVITLASGCGYHDHDHHHHDGHYWGHHYDK